MGSHRVKRIGQRDKQMETVKRIHLMIQQFDYASRQVHRHRFYSISPGMKGFNL
jgi:hypothetical protein